VPLRCPLCNRQLALVHVDTRPDEDDLEAQRSRLSRGGSIVNVTVMLDSHGRHMAPVWVEGLTVFNCVGTIALAAHLICAFLGSRD
jgi:hypothetical protein